VLATMGAEVISLERIPALAARARATLAALGLGDRVVIEVADGTLGWSARAPYDGILVTAAGPAIPRPLLAQLAPGAALVLPMGEEELQMLVRLRQRAAGRPPRVERGLTERAVRGGAAAVAVLAAVGCAGPAGLRHRVRPGENLYRIGKAYGLPYQELARVNGLTDPNRIEVGQVIVIPHATRELPVEVITPERARPDRPAARELPAGPMPFIWPVAGATVVSPFGPRGEGHHDGIDLSCPAGTPVRAVRAGRVLYADTLRGYGNLVILEHDAGYATVYAHNQENRVRPGDTVR